MAYETRESWTEASNPGCDDPVQEKDEDDLSNKSLNRVLEDNLKMVDIKRCSSTSRLELSRSHSPILKKCTSPTPEFEKNEIIESKIADVIAPERASELPRILQKGLKQTTNLLHDLPDVTDESVSSFQLIKECIYGSKNMGSSGDHDALDCDCSGEWRNGKNHACGEDSDCINRATKMECVDGQCNCGIGCQNTRFQNRSYADVSVIKTDKKGYGLRANTDLNPNDFIFEYIGEVINEPTFRRRTIQYNEEGIRHFYFMSLTKNEFIDATKKGNLGRFCNHSCNPNCYVDKWVVGAKLRMGVFAERNIAAGEELVFNYNVDRYGADPQPCYCEELNCTGYIGGKTQTERATKLPHTTIEALGIDDDDGWDLTVAKKPRKKKPCEDDEEYVNSVRPKALDEEGVRKVMGILMQCKEKWIAVKLLSRLQQCDDEKVRNRVVQMHGYQILRTTLTTWKDDDNVILQILDILYKLPRLTRNKICDSKIEAVIEKFVDSQHEDISFESKRLLDLWSKLEVAYRIPRKKFDPNVVTLFERRNIDRTDESTKSNTAANLVTPSGPRGSTLQRSGISTARPSIRRSYKALPSGWFTAKDEKGKTYYYSKSGETTWARPIYPAEEQPQPPKGPTKSVQTAKAIQDIIDSITKTDPNLNISDRHVLSTELTNTKEKKISSEKWRSLSKEKQMKLYENTYVMQKFHHKLPKEDLKKFAKEVGKKLVASDFKNERIEDPTKISVKQEKKVKSYVRAYFEKAVAKKGELDRRKKERERALAKLSNGDLKEKINNCSIDVKEEEENFDILSPSSPQRDNSPGTPSMKRKRDENSETLNGVELSEPLKKLKDEVVERIPTPPPPPSPPSGQLRDHCDEDQDMIDDEISVLKMEVEEKIQLRLQEEDLMRENEEAERLEKKNGTDVIALSYNQKEIGTRSLNDGIEYEDVLDHQVKEKEEPLSH